MQSLRKLFKIPAPSCLFSIALPVIAQAVDPESAAPAPRTAFARLRFTLEMAKRWRECSTLWRTFSGCLASRFNEFPKGVRDRSVDMGRRGASVYCCGKEDGNAR